MSKIENSLDRAAGCLLGLALGDALGAPFEGGPIERFVWRLIGKTRGGERRWTDDTQMSLDMAESLIACGGFDPDDMAARFAASYRWSRGYGPGAARLLKRIGRGEDWRAANRAIYPEGSFGNGGAMRAPIIGLYFAARPDALVDAARQSASITHAHPQGQEGAVLMASATALALSGAEPVEILRGATGHCALEPFTSRLTAAEAFLMAPDMPTVSEVVARLGNGMSAVESCVTALLVGLMHLDKGFVDMHSFAVSCGGDVDTIGAMSGAVWGAANGLSSLPEAALGELEQRQRLMDVAEALVGGATGGRDGV